MAGIIIFLVLIIGFVWLMVGLNAKAEAKEEEKEEQKKREAFYEMCAKEALFNIYIKFGKSWYRGDDYDEYPEFREWTRKEPVCSEDGIRLGYNFYITEEGIKMLQEFRGG